MWLYEDHWIGKVFREKSNSSSIIQVRYKIHIIRKRIYVPVEDTFDINTKESVRKILYRLL